MLGGFFLIRATLEEIALDYSARGFMRGKERGLITYSKPAEKVICKLYMCG